ncbi:MAG TPA: DNA translocase FtsK 4TM domain-containing protein, partial [Polyangia bacterium]|nr:DNA translocase FtsK 4TM domain-containing protein [Polyangia bacterium]
MLAFGLFAGLSMASMQLGAHQMMGPGGAATASGLYALAGVAGYLFIAGLLVMAVRCFRGRPFVDGVLEGMGALTLLVATAVLLHLPFTGA